MSKLRIILDLENIITNYGAKDIKKLLLRISLYAVDEHQDAIVLIHQPRMRIKNLGEDNFYGFLKIKALKAPSKLVSIVRLGLETLNVMFPMPKSINKNIKISHHLKEYVKGREYWETWDSNISRTAEEIFESSKNYVDVLENTFNFVIERLKLKSKMKERLGAAEAFRRREGDCDEFSDLFIALLRANNIPSRRVVGLFIAPVNGEVSWEYHVWCEAWVPTVGWVPFDPALGFFASISWRHISRVKMGLVPDRPMRIIKWSSKENNVKLNENDIKNVEVLKFPK